MPLSYRIVYSDLLDLLAVHSLETLVSLECCAVVMLCSVDLGITEDEAQDALLGDVAQHCCYGNRPAREMEIYQITSTSALHVSSRTSCNKYTASAITWYNVVLYERYLTPESSHCLKR